MIKTFSHFGVHNPESKDGIAVNSNAGDTLLFQATRDLFSRFVENIEWKKELLWEEVTEDKVNSINEKSKAVIVGGGGLFLKDQKGASTSASGWQWNCSIEMIDKLKVPLIVFGVGYNRFRNQEDFDPVFKEHLKAVTEKSLFLGMRNNGSCWAVQSYLPSVLKNKVTYQPCPTTIIWYLYEELVKKHWQPINNKNLVLNTAFDRRGMRFEESEEKILNQIAEVINHFSHKGWKVTLANHKPEDREIGVYLDKLDVKFNSVDLSSSGPEEIIKFYCDKDVIVGMRGHSQMIPFGLRRPIVSIVSHDKMKWFLDDIGYPEWGVDVRDKLFKQKLMSAIELVTNNVSSVEKITAVQENLWGITSKNMKKIKFLIG